MTGHVAVFFFFLAGHIAGCFVNFITTVAGCMDPIWLKHFGQREILKKIDLMEPEFDQPMTFDDSRIPDWPVAAGVEIGSWGYGVQVYRAARGHKRKRETPSNMCGFSCEEEMQEARQYLWNHGNYQIEQVSVECCVILAFSHGTSYFTGHMGGKMTGHFNSF